MLLLLARDMQRPPAHNCGGRSEPCSTLPPLQRREAQDAEIAQLRSRLAAEFDGGATRGSQEATQRGEALAVQLAEAQQRCAEYAAEAEAARVEAARLAGARDSAEATLQAAQAELDAAKQLVAAQEDGDVFREGTAGVGNPADVAAMGARLAELEGDNRQLAGQLAALQAGAGAQQAATAGVGCQLAELQQVSPGAGCRCMLGLAAQAACALSHLTCHSGPCPAGRLIT